MIKEVTDFRSNANEQIVQAAEVIGESKRRRDLFAEVCRGSKKVKTVIEIASKLGLTEKQVLDAGRVLATQGIIHQEKVESRVAYQKDNFLCQNKKKIINAAKNPRKLKSIPTKRTPIMNMTIKSITVPNYVNNAKLITIDDLGTFRKVKAIKRTDVKINPIYEKKFKRSIKNILGEIGDFKDWGGETNDLFSTNLLYKNRRLATTFAFKGKGTKGILTPRKMGKNGDQIQRLFRCPAQVFLIQYWSNINESVLEQMEYFAYARASMQRKIIYYGIIDGLDTQRIIKAYHTHF